MSASGRDRGMSKHTPGPWRVCPTDFRAVEGPDYLIVADIRSYNKDDSNLIAAAPDLLAALEAAIKANVHSLPPNCRAIGDEAPWVIQSRAAIKKAKGE